MFVVTGYANGDYSSFGTAYAPWSTIEAMASEGWIIQFHAGECGHAFMPNAWDSCLAGLDQSLMTADDYEYYIWNFGQTDAQYEARVTAETTAGLAEIQQKLGYPAGWQSTVFAAPFGAWGNGDNPWLISYWDSIFSVVFVQYIAPGDQVTASRGSCPLPAGAWLRRADCIVSCGEHHQRGVHSLQARAAGATTGAIPRTRSMPLRKCAEEGNLSRLPLPRGGSRDPPTKGVEQLVNYVFTDEFNGPAGSPPNPSKWNHETGRWTDNNELETYTHSTANAYLDGQGHLVIKARKGTRRRGRSYLGPADHPGPVRSEPRELRGADQVRSRDRSLACLVDARLGLPHGRRPQCGEIDMIEVYGQPGWSPDSTVHTADDNGNDTTREMPVPGGLDTGWHAWHLRWDGDTGQSPGSRRIARST